MTGGREGEANVLSLIGLGVAIDGGIETRVTLGSQA